MAHILKRLGEAALQFRQVGNKTLPPIISRREAAALKKQFQAEGKPWPYEHIFPGPAKNDPPYRNMFQKGHKVDKLKEIKAKEIEKKMQEMPALIAEYRKSQRINWDDVPLLDKVLLSRREIRDKYVKRALQKR
jgi:hypothetical protein